MVYTQGNLNSETGLPLSVFQIREGDEAGVFEMGMNHKNEIGDLSVILKAKYGIIERECYNKPKDEDSRQPKCTIEKEDMIVDALKSFKML